MADDKKDIPLLVSNDAASVGDSVNASDKQPLDLVAINRILRECGAGDAEPGVSHCLLEYAYRYVCEVLDEALAVSQHASKKVVDAADVQLALAYKAESLDTALPREMLAELATAKNAQPLPAVRPLAGIRLPSERHCLTAPNYRQRHRRQEARGLGRIQAPLVTAATVGGGSAPQLFNHPLLVTPGAAGGSGALTVPSGAHATGGGTVMRVLPGNTPLMKVSTSGPSSTMPLPSQGLKRHLDAD